MQRLAVLLFEDVTTANRQSALVLICFMLNSEKNFYEHMTVVNVRLC